MFTGLVETLAEVVEVRPEPPGVRSIVATGWANEVAIGDSISVNGCCLTVVEEADDRLAFQAGAETLSRTTLGRLKVGSRVNLERSMKLSDRLGGHLVAGHVDGIGVLEQRTDDRDWSTCYFRAPPELLRQMASKGSVAVDGVSLTIVEVDDERFSVALIPHTLSLTTLGNLRIGDPVNLETDLLAKYVQRRMQAGETAARLRSPKSSG